MGSHQLCQPLAHWDLVTVPEKDHGCSVPEAGSLSSFSLFDFLSCFGEGPCNGCSREWGESARTEVSLRALLRLGQGKRPKTLGHRENSESPDFRRLPQASTTVSVPGPAVMLPAPTE